MKKLLKKFLKKLVSAISMAVYRTVGVWSKLIVMGLILSGLFILPIFLYFSKDLPDYNQLMDYDPPTISRIYSGEGELMSELAVERRIYRKLDEMPKVLIHAFVSAEDQNYFDHPGIDLTSIFRAAVQNIANMGSDRNPVGGSTITQQVVKNFLLTNERSFSRKIKEAILAYRINKVYSKERILELYLNQIYLGNGAYGVTSAALAYFNKDLKDVTIEEAALLAALPKAPSVLDPTKNSKGAKARRDWVIERMLEEEYIKKDQAKEAQTTPIKLETRFDSASLDNGYYTETVRLDLIEKYGYDHVYQDGYSVYTNLNTEIQKYADEALREGLLDYDKKHGFKGPITTTKFKSEEWKSIIKSIETPEGAGKWRLAIVISSGDSATTIGLKDGNKGTIPLANLSWARKRLSGGYVGKKIEKASEVLKSGDIILVSQENGGTNFKLEQIPEVNGAVVVMQPRTGKVLALSGGFSFRASKYNRAVQAMRQPGSTFKPIVYLTGLEKGLTPTTIIKDEPITVSQGPGLPPWTPKNYSGDFWGEITMRKALEKSRNLATVNLIQRVGVKSVALNAHKLGVYQEMPPLRISMALGALETTLLKMTSVFATFASDGQLIEPKLIDRVQDRKGNVIFKTDSRECSTCVFSDDADPSSDEYGRLPKLSSLAKNVVEPMTNYQLVSMLEGTVLRGTAARARELNRVIAGKTGTSNDSNDVWFIGFSPDIAVGVYVGYDNPRSLGKKETGASLALPIFINFFKKANDIIPNREFSVPDGIIFKNIDIETGQDAGLITRSRNIVKEPIKMGSGNSNDNSDEGSSSFFFGSGSTDSEQDVNFGGGGVY